MILEHVISQISRDLEGRDVPIFVADASPEPYLSAVTDLWERSILGLHRTAMPASLPVSYDYLLSQAQADCIYVQFDDVFTLNLSTAFLQASGKLVQTYGDQVPVVRSLWPLEIRIDDDSQRITVITDGVFDGPLEGRTYEVRPGTHRRPVALIEIDGFRFGIFENFGYGFLFNPLVTGRADYLWRLRWYMDHISRDNPHDIELAAADRTQGPAWRHIGICLDGDVVMLDIDFAHTDASVRPEPAGHRQLFGALDAGYEIATSPPGSDPHRRT